MSQLFETEFYKILSTNSKYKEKIDAICTKFKEHSDSCTAFSSYTSHSIDHSVNIINHMYHLCPNPSQLNEDTIFYLILAAICHDFGLLLTNDDKKDIESNSYITKQSDYYFWDKTKEFVRLHNLQLEDHKIVELTIEFIARNLHTNQEVLLKKINHICSNQLSNNEKKNLVFICYAHGANPEDIKQQLRYPEKILVNDVYDCNSRVDFGFVIALLRLGDLLDIGVDRVIKTSKEYNYYDKENEKHEIINSLIRTVNIRYERTDYNVCGSSDKKLSTPCPRYPKEIFLSFNNDYFSDELFQEEKNKSLFSDCLNYLFTYIDWIEKEIANAKNCFLHQYLSSDMYTAKYRYATTLSISPKVNMVGFPYNYEYREIDIDRNRIVNLITSENLYPNKKSFLRELIQNAIDACIFYSDIIGTSPYNPEVKISLDNDILSITDNGIGMNYTTLINYYLKIGGSYYNSNEYIFSNKRFSHAGHFGIGGYSAFLVSDEVILETKRNNQECIKVEYGKAQNYVKISREVTDSSCFSHQYDHGTKIILKLKDEFKKTFIDINSIIRYLKTTFLKYENVSLKLLVQEREYNLSQQLQSIDDWCKNKIQYIKEPIINQLDNYLEGINCRIIYNQIETENKYFNENINNFDDECPFAISDEVLVYSYENNDIIHNYIVPYNYNNDKFYYGKEKFRVVKDLCMVKGILFTTLGIPIGSMVNRFTAEIISLNNQKNIINSSLYSSFSNCSVRPKLDIFLHNIHIKNADFNLEFMPNLDVDACVLNITHPLVVPSISRDDIPMETLKQIREAIFYAILKELKWTTTLPIGNNNPFIKEEKQ